MFKSQHIFLLFAVVILVVAIQADEQCGKNQQFTNCGSACPPKCNDEPAKICTLQCIIGCQCKPGYLLNSKNECVTPQEC
ncbi:chymotrypsin inhibitor-like [Lucilia sericata]|uniref:chymotrypsin inhibitor-like n=1 Tax=Lucilia sericata TaxID=13632 RepID=UPI0018A866F9|nr:chymotrypsin inhibitor-like [Lucilia sericata]